MTLQEGLWYLYTTNKPKGKTMKLATAERHVGQTKLRLTPRGRVVVGILAFLAFLAAWALLDHLTTPEVCRVPFEEMSQGCINLLYPN